MFKIFFLSLVLILSIVVNSFGQELPRSASFGALVSDLNDSSRIALALSSISGSHIKKVVPGSSADRAGIKMDDVVISIDGQNIQNTNQFLALLKKHHGGDKLKISFYRESKIKQTTITLLPKPIETSEAYEIIYSSVKSGNNQLRTIITKPKGNGVYPAVLLVGGVGCYSVDNSSVIELQSIKTWSDSLTKNGFVTIRIEKTGMGDSKGLPCNECDFKTETQGFLDGLKQLKTLTYVNKEKVFIAGFSIGGIIAPLIAQQEPVKGIIVYGTVGRNWLEYEMDNSLRQQLLANRSADSVDLYMRAEYIRLYSLFVEKKLPEQIMQEHPQTISHLFNYPMRIEYFQQVADVNIRELWMKTQSKVLAMHGSSDFVSSDKEHALIAEIVNYYHPGNATYAEIDNSDHWGLLAESDTISYLQLQKGVNPLPLTTTIKWLKTQT
jgi:pimeloyl-ACP methyl ester carboxylesterase